jgi:hypothetical protein
VSRVAIDGALNDHRLCFESQHGVSVSKKTSKKVPPRMAADRFPIFTALVLAALSMVGPAAAQTVAKPAVAEKAADPKAAEAAKALAAGTKAFEGGKTDAAVAALSTAITMGGLNNRDLAKAMFYRGVAYRKQKMPAAALSDLNAAVWLRDGLSATDKAVAEDHRQALLREVAALNGVAAPATVETASTPVSSVPAPTATPTAVSTSVAEPQAQTMPWAMAEVTPTAAPVVAVAEAPKAIEAAALPAPSPPVAPTPAPASLEENRTTSVPVSSAPSLDADTISEPVAIVAPVKRDPIATVQAEAAPPEKPLPWQMATNAPQGDTPSARDQAALPWGASAAAPSVSVAAVASEPPPAPAASVATTFAPEAPKPDEVPSTVTDAPAALADAGKAAGAFLGNLFSGGSSASGPATSLPPANEPAPLAASKIETAALPEKPKSVEPAPVVWPAETKAAPAIEVPPVKVPEVKVAAAEPAASANAPPPAAVLPGPYRLHIAAENSRADAEQTLSRLLSAHKPSLRGLEPVIEEPATGGVLFGSMGAAYRVSVGPYSSSMEPGRLCNILKPHGFDCRVVAIAP